MPEQDSQAGATYEYKINNQRKLDFVRELSPQDVTPRLYGSAIANVSVESFGKIIDVSGDFLVVGSDRWNDIDGQRYGAVFLYEDPGIVVCGHLDGLFCDSFESD